MLAILKYRQPIGNQLARKLVAQCLMSLQLHPLRSLLTASEAFQDAVKPKSWTMNRFLGTLLAAALVLSGCAPTNEARVGGYPRAKDIRSVISLSPSTTELMNANMQFQIFVGRTAACDWPLSVRGAQVVANVKPDYERIASLKPDLILVDKQLYSDADLAKIKQVGGEVWLWDPKSLADYKKSVVELSAKVGGENNTSLYLDRIDTAVDGAKARMTGKKYTVAVVLPDKSGKHMWLGADSFQAEEVRAAQLDVIGPKSDKFEGLDSEALIKADPDFILIASKSPDDFLKDARFAGLKAIKGNQAFGLNPDLILRRGGRVDLLIDNLSKKIYGAK